MIPFTYAFPTLLTATSQAAALADPTTTAAAPDPAPLLSATGFTVLAYIIVGVLLWGYAARLWLARRALAKS